MVNLNELKAIVIKQYQDTYRNWKDIRVTETIKTTNEGSYFVVRATDNGVETEGEICYIDNTNKVTIFSTTEELIRFIDNKQNQKWYQQLFSKAGISAIVTLALLITLCILVFRPGKADQNVLQIIGGAFLAAVGFLFGTATNKAT